MARVDAADAAVRAAFQRASQRVLGLPVAAAVFVAALLLALAVFFLARDAPPPDERAGRHALASIDALSSHRHAHPRHDYHSGTHPTLNPNPNPNPNPKP